MEKIRRSKDDEESLHGILGNSGRNTVISVLDVYGETCGTDKEENFDLSREDAIRDTESFSVKSKEDVTRKSRLTIEDDLDGYDDVTFSTQQTSESEDPTRDDDSFKSTPRLSPRRRLGSKKCSSDSVDEERLRDLLKSYLKVHDPKAIKDGRLEGLIKWSRERSVAKLRIALQERFGADLYAPGSKLPIIAERPQSRGALVNSLRSLFGR